MCDYSLMHLASRPAKVGDKLVSSAFSHTISHGFVEDGVPDVAVCLLPGTEIGFDQEPKTRIQTLFQRVFGWQPKQKVATFRQINLDNLHTHHDALEFADGNMVMVHNLEIGQRASVLQLPAAPKTEREAAEQKRLDVVA